MMTAQDVNAQSKKDYPEQMKALCREHGLLTEAAEALIDQHSHPRCLYQVAHGLCALIGMNVVVVPQLLNEDTLGKLLSKEYHWLTTPEAEMLVWTRVDRTRRAEHLEQLFEIARGENPAEEAEAYLHPITESQKRTGRACSVLNAPGELQRRAEAYLWKQARSVRSQKEYRTLARTLSQFQTNGMSAIWDACRIEEAFFQDYGTDYDSDTAREDYQRVIEAAKQYHPSINAATVLAVAAEALRTTTGETPERDTRRTTDLDNSFLP